MPAPYSDDFRQKVLDALERGERKSHLSRIFNLSRNTIDLWLKRRAATGSADAIRHYRALNETARCNVPLSADKLKMPVLAISGGGNGGMGQFQVDQTKDYADNVEGYVLPDCGHWLPEECSEKVNQLVIDFLS